MQTSLQLPPELLYEVISDVVASWIDLAITAPISVAPAQGASVEASPGASGSTASDELGSAEDDEEVSVDDGDGVETDVDVDPPSHSELRRQLVDRAAGIDVDESLPPNYAEPLLLVSHVVREVTLRILSEALDIPRDLDGRLYRNPWACIKNGRRIRCLLLSPTIRHMREPLLIVWEGRSLFAVYGSIAMLDLTQLKFALHPSPSTLHVMTQAALIAGENTKFISRSTIVARAAARIQRLDSYTTLLSEIGQFRCIMDCIVEDLKTHGANRNWEQMAPIIKLTFKGIRSFRQHFLPDATTLNILPEHIAKALDLSTMTSSMRHELARIASKVDLCLPGAESLFKYSRKGMHELSRITYIWDSATFAQSDPPLTY
ncbi:hypothetical protein BDN71DRAFT_7950 [Pleurotus eryngii]|uniref:Uncharacterized protein n=1 Tax=Pleurotus eryngii TaxID=5323 RepID=A0A9P6DKL8_PLEER|nr:hypothetical protein BDN71DRAFT_7950 [Pleurotus eryngii]